MSVCPSVCLSVCLSVFLSFCLSVCLSVCLSFSLSLSLLLPLCLCLLIPECRISVLVVGVYGGGGVNPGGGLVRGHSQPVLHLLLRTSEDAENLSQVQMFCSVFARL